MAALQRAAQATDWETPTAALRRHLLSVLPARCRGPAADELCLVLGPALLQHADDLLSLKAGLRLVADPSAGRWGIDTARADAEAVLAMHEQVAASLRPGQRLRGMCRSLVRLRRLQQHVLQLGEVQAYRSVLTR